MLTGRHTADHGIFAEHIFSEANQNVTDLSQPLLWKHVKSLGTVWVCTVRAPIISRGFYIFTPFFTAVCIVEWLLFPVTDLSQPLLWKHVKSLGTVWVCISVLHV